MVVGGENASEGDGEGVGEVVEGVNNVFEGVEGEVVEGDSEGEGVADADVAVAVEDCIGDN